MSNPALKKGGKLPKPACADEITAPAPAPKLVVETAPSIPAKGPMLSAATRLAASELELIDEYANKNNVSRLAVMRFGLRYWLTHAAREEPGAMISTRVKPAKVKIDLGIAE